MRLVGYELKKIFFHQKGFLFVLLFLFIKIISLLVLDKPVNDEMQIELPRYSYYLEKVQGKITKETTEFFIEEATKLSDANVSLQKLNHEYYEGNIDKKEYKDRLKPLQETLENEKGFDIIYDEYIYAYEHPDNRFLLYTNGWDGLLSQEKLDWLFIILLFLLITPVFCEEIGSKMDIIILTEKNGGNYNSKCKIGVAITLAIICSILNTCIEYAFYLNKYGLENSGFPLQSLSFFGSTGKEINLFGAFVGISCLKLLGSICLTVLILYLSVYVKRYAIILLINTIILIFPLYTFSLQSTKYWISPLGFFVATGFYRGNEYRTDIFTGQTKILFQEITYSKLLLLVSVTICICVGMIVMILKKNTNIWYKKRNIHREGGVEWRK